jgi:hypothetical protein
MMMPKRFAFLFAALLLTGPVHAANSPGDSRVTAGEADLHSLLAELERRRADAIVRRDIASLRLLMDRQYHHIDSRGRVRSKTELLTLLERDAFRFRVYEIESTEVQALGGGTALVTGTLRTLQAGASAKPFRGRFAHLWVRQPDGWKNSFHQVTGIRPTQGDCQCD